jgi:hypothetical protein
MLFIDIQSPSVSKTLERTEERKRNNRKKRKGIPKKKKELKVSGPKK